MFSFLFGQYETVYSYKKNLNLSARTKSKRLKTKQKGGDRVW